MHLANDKYKIVIIISILLDLLQLRAINIEPGIDQVNESQTNVTTK